MGSTDGVRSSVGAEGAGERSGRTPWWGWGPSRLAARSRKGGNMPCLDLKQDPLTGAP